MVLSIAKQGFWSVRTRDCMASYRADNNDKYTKLDRAFGVQLWKMSGVNQLYPPNRKKLLRSKSLFYKVQQR